MRVLFCGLPPCGRDLAEKAGIAGEIEREGRRCHSFSFNKGRRLVLPRENRAKPKLGQPRRHGAVGRDPFPEGKPFLRFGRERR
jgi:hypothetical protein